MFQITLHSDVFNLLIVNFQKAMMHQISALQPIGHLCKSRPERWGRQCSHPWSASPAPASSQAWLLPEQVHIIEKCTATQLGFCQIRLSTYQSLIFPQTLQRFWILPDIATSEGARKILFSERKTKNKFGVPRELGDHLHLSHPNIALVGLPY